MQPINRAAAEHLYKGMISQARHNGREWDAMRALAKGDLYYLLTHILNRPDAENDWAYARCREVQAHPDGFLDLWAREHYKSTIITFALTIQDILNDPEDTFGFFSHTRPIAKGPLRQIKREFETNELLRWLFPDILWDKPQRDAPKWSEDDGIIVKRKGNPNAATIEAWGVVDGQPTSKHFRKLIYDDMVTKESVTNPDRIQNVTDSWALSLNLGTKDGIQRYIGTRYHFADTYGEMIKRRAAIPRIYPATKNGMVEGEPVLLTKEQLAEKRRKMGSYVFACQMLQNPQKDSSMGFRESDLRYWPAQTYNGMNIYIVVDPANEKNKKSDYTSMWVIGAASDENYMVIKMVRDKLNLRERTNTLFALHRAYRPIRVGYEKYSMQADTQHIEEVMNRENYRFELVELHDGLNEDDRIRRLSPIVEAHRLWLPDKCVHVNYEGDQEDLVKVFVNDEYLTFPHCLHNDMLTALSRMLDDKMGIVFPKRRSTPLQTHAIADERRGYGLV